MSEPAGTGTRHRVPYRGENCYMTLTDQSLEISMVAKDPLGQVDERSLTGLGIISELTTMLIESGANLEEVAGRIWSQSRNKGDLADLLSGILTGK